VKTIVSYVPGSVNSISSGPTSFSTTQDESNIKARDLNIVTQSQRRCILESDENLTSAVHNHFHLPPPKDFRFYHRVF